MKKRKRKARAERRGSGSLENPTTPLSDPEDWLFDALGAERTSSGIRVTSKTAMTLSAVYRATCLIARSVAKIPIDIYKRVGEGKERDKGHKAYRLLRKKPNPYMTAFKFKETMLALTLNRGNGYAFIDRRGNGDPVALLILDPEVTYPVRANGELWYVTKVGGEIRKIPAHDMIHLRGLGDGIEGRSVISWGAESMGVALATQKFAGVFFKNGVNPSVVIEFPGRVTVDDAELVRKTWEELHTGLEDKHRAAVLGNGAKLNSYSKNNEETQLIESRKFGLVEIANWYGLPPHKLGDDSRTAFASLEQENQSFLDDALDPWLVMAEEEFEAKLLTDEEQENDTHLVEFNRNALLRANFVDRMNGYNTAILNGSMTRDEVRARENMNPLPAGAGAKPMRPANMIVEGEEPPDPEPPSPPVVPDDDERQRKIAAAHRSVLLDVTQRLVRRFAERAAKEARVPDGYMPWVESLEEKFRGEVAAAAAPAVEAWRTVARRESGAPADFAAAFLRRVGEHFLAPADSTPAELGVSVMAACARLEALPAKVVDEWMEA